MLDNDPRSDAAGTIKSTPTSLPLVEKRTPVPSVVALELIEVPFGPVVAFVKGDALKSNLLNITCDEAVPVMEARRKRAKIVVVKRVVIEGLLMVS